MRSHEWIEERSLALDRQVAAKLRADPSLLERARATLEVVTELEPYLTSPLPSQPAVSVVAGQPPAG